MSRMFLLSFRQHIWKYRRWLVSILAIVVALLGTWIAVVVGYGDPVSPPAELSKQSNPFQPDETQWSDLGFEFESVKQVTFREQRPTDGKISIGEDTTTLVFFPYFHPITHMVAGRADHVERGGVLFAIEPNEAMQVRYGLVAPLAGTEIARSSFILAQTAKKREKGQQSFRCGALTDLRQAGSNPVPAPSGLRSAVRGPVSET